MQRKVSHLLVQSLVCNTMRLSVPPVFLYTFPYVCPEPVLTNDRLPWRYGYFIAEKQKGCFHTTGGPSAKKRLCFECSPYVCPEPVLAK